jgi:hypothetical protein
MPRRFKPTPKPFTIALSLGCAAVLFAALTGATLIPQSARAADLRLPAKPAAQQETPSERRKRLFEEFLRLRQKH